jgi:hypothetical protein
MKNQFVASMLMPKGLRTGSVLRDGLGIMSHLFKDYGWLKSQKAGRCLDAQGLPIPWFTYPAIDFIKQLDLRELTVFEYGSGASTLFWSKRAKEIVSTESDKEWFEEISARSAPNMKVVLASNGVESYVLKIVEHGMFDIIVIDGTGDSRLACSQLAPKHLKPGGFIILDNSDLWLNSAAALRNADLIQVDFTGLAPLSRHWSTTSIFFSRQYSVQPLDGYQPHKSVAQPATPWPGA